MEISIWLNTPFLRSCYIADVDPVLPSDVINTIHQYDERIDQLEKQVAIRKVNPEDGRGFLFANT